MLNPLLSRWFGNPVSVYVTYVPIVTKLLSYWKRQHCLSEANLASSLGPHAYCKFYDAEHFVEALADRVIPSSYVGPSLGRWFTQMERMSSPSRGCYQSDSICEPEGSDICKKSCLELTWKRVADLPTSIYLEQERIF